MKYTLVLLIVLLLTIVSDNALAQDPILLERYVCPSASESVFEYNDIQAEKSDGACHVIGLETVLGFEVSGDTDMAKVTIERTGGGPYRAKVKIDWLNDQPGILTIEVYYRRFIAKFFGCDLTGQRYLYTYKIYRQGANPAGDFDGEKTITAPNESTVSVFNFNYKPSSTYPESLTARKISYRKNETEWETKDIIKEENGDYVSTPVIYNATGIGNFQLEAKVLDDCDVWHPLPITTLTVYPSCYQDNASQVRSSIAELEHLEFPESSKVEANTQYSVHVTGITNVSDHYTWNTEDGGENILFDGNSFVLKQGLGSYRIIANKKPGRELCPTIPAIFIFSGGSDVTLRHDCAVIIPDIFQDQEFLAQHGLQMMEPTNIVFEHFAATIVSKKSIIVKPGVTLALGAEMKLDLPPPAPEPRDPDLDMNFVEQSAYDEYGRVLLSNRSYFDGRGMGIQNQFKVLSKMVTMASATLYDSYGRPVISTLAAPTSAAIRTLPDACGIQARDQTIKFGFKEDFVKTESGLYNYKNFDVISDEETKEESPDPLDASVPGTLGWYYSENNGTAPYEQAAMNEPLTAATSFPYARTLYHHDGSGEIKGFTRPGDAFRAGTGKIVATQKEKVSASDEYLDAYLDMRMELGFSKPSGEMLEGNFFRTEVTDENNKKSITYTDKSGGTIISLYFGEDAAPITTSYQFFDNAGRLIASVSPNGVDRYDGTNFEDIDKTTYEYNYKGWLLKLTEPDAGTTEYLYRKDGKIRFSQNEQQKDEESFSYTNYDRAGRPVESGEYSGEVNFESGLNEVLEVLGYEGGLSEGKKSSWIRTYYDQPAEALAVDFNEGSLTLPVSRTQRFVFGAVSCSQNENTTTWYSYDERNRVEWMVQRINNAPSEAFSIKTIDYRYGPTGAVQEVLYQKDQPDQFTHYYEYDSDGRLVKVYTTTDKLVYNKLGELSNPKVLSLQATYYYYLHGPLKRIELENKLQGIDYVYTADGALKAINHHDPEKDPSGDGIKNDFTKDVFGMTLDYYTQDYASADYDETELELSGYEDIYSGIIKAVRWHGPIEPGKSHAYAFRYDERYQLLDASWAEVSGSTVTLSGQAYRETIGGYDKNGNIGSLHRMNNLGNTIADFDLYQVEAHGNQLKRIVSNDKEIRSYDYDKIGRMTYENNSEGERFVDYDVSGKVIGVYRQKEEDGTLKSPMVTFGYGDRGFRLFKTTFDDKGAKTRTTWYVRDATGNIAGTYEEHHEANEEPLLVEVPVYGSGRIGMYKPAYGQTLYEVTDHLGNVRAVIGGSIQTTMLATMEKERQEKESQHFFGMRTTLSATDINHTASTVTVDGETDIVDPNEVIRLNNRPNGRYSPNPIGGGTMLWVHPGDTIRAEVFAKYARLDQSQNKSELIALAAMMKNLSPMDNAVEMRKAFRMLGSSNFRSLPAWGKLDDAQPPAFLNGLLFDKDMKLQSFDFDQVSEKARMQAVEDKEGHEKLELAFVAEKEGYLYIYISNESTENLDVYFDDLRVTHVYGAVIAGGDYYPYGLPIEDRQITLENYRYGYQGQFSEKDEETEWNHFELREYDAELGRWLVPDPMRENWSPYVAMGNSPINIVDPDGGCEKCPKDGITGHVGDITKILGKNYIWDGNDWLPISQEAVIEANKPTMNELFDRFIPAPPDAVTYVITPPKGKLFRNYSKGLYVYSSGGGGGGSGINTRDPNQDPAAEGIDLAWFLQFNDGRGEDEHGIIQREHDKHSAVHNSPPVPVDTIVEKDWGFTDYPDDSSGRVIWEKYYRVIDSNADTSQVQMETLYNSPLKRPK